MRHVLLAMVVLIPFALYAQESPRTLDECSKVLASIERAAENVTQDQIDLLLASTTGFCLSSVEYSEWANELIYAVIIANPDEFLNSFSTQESETKANIIKGIESPVHDGIDLVKSFVSISSAADMNDKEPVLEAIRIAATSIGLEL